MKEMAVYVLAIFSIANACVVYYFFVHKQNKIDKEYKSKLERIYGK